MTQPGLKTDVDRRADLAVIDLLELAGATTQLRRESSARGGSWSGPCPRCGGRDRFVVRPNGDESGRPPAWWCRKCHPQGGDAIGFVMWLDGLPYADAVARLTSGTDAKPRWIKPRQARERESRQGQPVRVKKRKQGRPKYRESECVARLLRGDSVVGDLMAGGICEEAVVHFGLGLDTWHVNGSRYPALTIPWRRAGRLEALQYRLLGEAPSGGRYRWAPGSSGHLWNGDAALHPTADHLIVCEGAKKGAAVWSSGLCSVCAVPNNTSAARILADHAHALSEFERVYVILDPDSPRYAGEAASKVPGAHVVHLSAKVDDWLVMRGCDGEALQQHLRTARRVR